MFAISNELKAGLIGAFVIHAAFLYVLSLQFLPNRFQVQISPSSLEIALVASVARKVPPPKVVEVKKEVEKVIERQEPEAQIKIEKQVEKKAEEKIEIKIEQIVKEVQPEKIEVAKVIEEVKVEPKRVEVKKEATVPYNPQSGAVTEAKPVDYFNKPPAYPRAARRRGYEGTALVRVFITRKGLVEDARVIRSSGYDILDKAALESVLKWRFEPAQQFGAPVKSTSEIPFVFRLDEENAF